MIASRRRSSSVWSSSVCSERSIGMPEAIRVANWREKIARSRALIAAEAVEDLLEPEGLVLLGDVEDDQAALAQLLGDLSL